MSSTRERAKPELLTRDAFRRAVFARDGGKCVLCDGPAVDAHHIVERRLFSDGGYYLDNGASVCAHHHLACEMTVVSVEDVREACGIKRRIVPSHLYADQMIDKWGNPILTNGQRLRGELFDDPSVRSILERGNVLGLFTQRVKYARTHHAPWSLGVSDDDRIIESMEGFVGRRVVVTEKMDGENSTVYRDYVHARSVESGGHPSRDWLKGFVSAWQHELPEGWRVCGENLYAKHSIAYSDLPSYFMGFSVWNEWNACLEWDETLEWFELLGVTSVPVLYDGTYDEQTIRSLWSDAQHESSEGYVVRLAGSFPYGDFRRSVCKFVRKDHVRTAKHWFFGQRIERNGLNHER